MHDLDLSGLPNLPQSALLRDVATELWADPAVVALWLGGSLARGAGDSWSDVDLRVALRPEAFSAEGLPTGARLLEQACVGLHRAVFGERVVLYHMLLEEGTFYDLVVQTSDAPPHEEIRTVLGCRDDTYAALLVSGHDPTVAFPTADGATIRQVIVTYWMSQQKHLRVLHRRLPLLGWEGEHRMRQEVVRLWFVLATGNDCGPLSRLTIHTFSPVARAVEQLVGASELARSGAATGTAEELIAATMWSRAEVARIGRLLADKLAFAYPEELEATVERSWTLWRTLQTATALPYTEKTMSKKPTQLDSTPLSRRSRKQHERHIKEKLNSLQWHITKIKTHISWFPAELVSWIELCCETADTHYTRLTSQFDALQKQSTPTKEQYIALKQAIHNTSGPLHYPWLYVTLQRNRNLIVEQIAADAHELYGPGEADKLRELIERSRTQIETLARQPQSEHTERLIATYTRNSMLLKEMIAGKRQVNRLDLLNQLSRVDAEIKGVLAHIALEARINHDL